MVSVLLSPVFRCLQDKVRGQFFSDLITNRKEKVLLQVSEDCLYLNVYTPVSTEAPEKLPVSRMINPLAKSFPCKPTAYANCRLGGAGP